MVTLKLRQIDFLPGQQFVLREVSWQQFEAILKELGEHRSSRVAYSHRTLKLMTPSPEHEITKEIIGDLVKILLEELGIDCESFGSTTLKRQDLERGVEPDVSFYIENHKLMIGCDRLDLSVAPPPDLAIEIDLTSKTQLDTYEALGVRELWRLEKRCLTIYILSEGKYFKSSVSPTFPNLPILTIIPQYLEQARSSGRSSALRAFREYLRQKI